MAVANSAFHPSLLPKPHEHRPSDEFAQKFDRCILATAGRVGLWGGASQRKGSQEQRAWRWPRRSGENARRRSPRWLPKGVY